MPRSWPPAPSRRPDGCMRDLSDNHQPRGHPTIVPPQSPQRPRLPRRPMMRRRSSVSSSFVLGYAPRRLRLRALQLDPSHPTTQTGSYQKASSKPATPTTAQRHRASNSRALDTPDPHGCAHVIRLPPESAHSPQEPRPGSTWRGRRCPATDASRCRASPLHSVTKPCLHHLDALAVADQQRGVEVAQIVKAGTVRRTGRRYGSAPHRPERSPADRPAMLVGEHQTVAG